MVDFLFLGDPAARLPFFEKEICFTGTNSGRATERKQRWKLNSKQNMICDILILTFFCFFSTDFDRACKMQDIYRGRVWSRNTQLPFIFDMPHAGTTAAVRQDKTAIATAGCWLLATGYCLLREADTGRGGDKKKLLISSWCHVFVFRLFLSAA